MSKRTELQNELLDDLKAVLILAENVVEDVSKYRLQLLGLACRMARERAREIWGPTADIDRKVAARQKQRHDTFRAKNKNDPRLVGKGCPKDRK